MSKVQIEELRRHALRVYGPRASVVECRMLDGTAQLRVHLAKRRAHVFEGRSIQSARRFALEVLQHMPWGGEDTCPRGLGDARHTGGYYTGERACAYCGKDPT